MAEESLNTNATKAAALAYNGAEDSVPRVVASGRGLLAERILDEARKHNISVYKDPLLVEALVQLDVGQYIPPELYEAVAKILAFIYYLDDKAGEDDL
jgi:flagellar biosynthesis protein